MLYYLHKTLQYGRGFIEKGSVHPLASLSVKSLNILESKGIITTFSVPPMDQLPGWRLRFKRFEEHGIDVHVFFSMPDAEIAERIGSRPHIIAKWRAELRKLLGLNRAKIRHG